MLSSVMPANVVRTFQKASLMVATSGRTVLNFDLTSAGPVIAALANCVTKVKADGLNKAGDFTKVAAKPQAAADKQTPPAGSKPARAKSGTGFVVSASGHVVTNNHVIDGCVGDIKGNLTGDAWMVLHVVSSDANNDLALLPAPSTATFKDFARIPRPLDPLRQFRHRDRLSLSWVADLGLHRDDRYRQFAQRLAQR